jgi:hypothetical protein
MTAATGSAGLRFPPPTEKSIGRKPLKILSAFEKHLPIGPLRRCCLT